MPLEGRRHLTVLDLETSAPVGLAPLCTVPNLRCVDLTRTDVADLTVLGDLSGLRYLALTSRQWAVLLEAGAVPRRLAAARLVDEEVPSTRPSPGRSASVWIPRTPSASPATSDPSGGPQNLGGRRPRP
ncbi:hypothetical protein GCM10023405_20100 [Streptomonospora salina]